MSKRPITCFITSMLFISNNSHGLLICTLISENQSLEKSRSISNPRKISGSANLDFFQVWHLIFFRFIVWQYRFLICTLISENQGLEKSRSISNSRKIIGSADLDFFLGLHHEKSWVYTINLEKIQVPDLKKRIKVCRT